MILDENFDKLDERIKDNLLDAQEEKKAKEDEKLPKAVTGSLDSLDL